MTIKDIAKSLGYISLEEHKQALADAAEHAETSVSKAWIERIKAEAVNRQDVTNTLIEAARASVRKMATDCAAQLSEAQTQAKKYAEESAKLTVFLHNPGDPSPLCGKVAYANTTAIELAMAEIMRLREELRAK